MPASRYSSSAAGAVRQHNLVRGRLRVSIQGADANPE